MNAHLNKTLLNRRQLEFISLGGSVGSGLFVGMAQGLRSAGPSMALAYAIAGLMVFIIARCLADMALGDPTPSPFLECTRKFLGERAAFVQGWSYWSCALLVAMAELTAIGMLLRTWFPMLPPWIASLAGLVALFLVNRLSVRVFGEIEFWMSSLKLAAIVGFIMLGLVLLMWANPTPLGAVSVTGLWRDGGLLPAGLQGLLLVFPTALFAFGGAELIGIAAAEAADPHRLVPRATNAVLFRLVLFYVGTTAIVLCLLPWRTISPDSSPMVTILSKIGVNSAASLMNLVLISAVLSAGNSTLYAAARILRMLAEMRAAPRRLARLNVHGVPGSAVLASTAIVSLAVVLNYLLPAVLFQLLLGVAAVIGLANWAMILVAHLSFCKSGDAKPGRSFPVPMAPWTNYLVLFLIGVAAVLFALDPGLRVVLCVAAAVFLLLIAAYHVVAQGQRA